LKTLLVVLVFLVLVLSACVSPSPIDELNALRQQTVLIDLADGTGTCSGVMVAPATVLTAAHCVPNDIKVIKVKGLAVEQAVSNSEADIAILTVPGLKCPCASVATQRPRVDTELVAIGYPMRMAEYLTEGRLMGNIIDPQAPDLVRAHFMATSIPLAFGNSGGPVFARIDGKWQVVGVVSGVRNADFSPIWHLSIVVSTETINAFLAKHFIHGIEKV
jgi:S1-C subfamily serine protease